MVHQASGPLPPAQKLGPFRQGPPKGAVGEAPLTCSPVSHQPADFALHSSEGLSGGLLGQKPNALEVMEGQQVLGPIALGAAGSGQEGT